MDMPKGDKLVLRGLKFHGYHGVKQEERKLGQKFLVDVDAWMDLRSAGESDCLSDTLSYTDIYRTNDFISSRSKNLTHLKHLREHTEADFLMLCSFLDIPSYMGILMPLLEALRVAIRKARNSNSLISDIRLVKEVMEGPPKNLLESVAQLIASTTLTKYPEVSAVRVQVGKPHVAVQGPVDYLGVEIIRYRSLDVQN
uniref:Dihydroneopterin aldolase/epimerase domain-containing protein n=1 Tax=Solanum lycopersicum TaxID=4081 RepID=A0A3Q7IKQ1_SOLLC